MSFGAALAGCHHWGVDPAEPNRSQSSENENAPVQIERLGLSDEAEILRIELRSIEADTRVRILFSEGTHPALDGAQEVLEIEARKPALRQTGYSVYREHVRGTASNGYVAQDIVTILPTDAAPSGLDKKTFAATFAPQADVGDPDGTQGAGRSGLDVLIPRPSKNAEHREVHIEAHSVNCMSVAGEPRASRTRDVHVDFLEGRGESIARITDAVVDFPHLDRNHTVQIVRGTVGEVDRSEGASYIVVSDSAVLDADFEDSSEAELLVIGSPDDVSVTGVASDVAALEEWDDVRFERMDLAAPLTTRRPLTGPNKSHVGQNVDEQMQRVYDEFGPPSFDVFNMGGELRSGNRSAASPRRVDIGNFDYGSDPEPPSGPGQPPGFNAKSQGPAPYRDLEGPGWRDLEDVDPKRLGLDPQGTDTFDLKSPRPGGRLDPGLDF
jgi:hypothetical protein